MLCLSQFVRTIVFPSVLGHGRESWEGVGEIAVKYTAVMHVSKTHAQVRMKKLCNVSMFQAYRLETWIDYFDRPWLESYLDDVIRRQKFTQVKGMNRSYI